MGKREAIERGRERLNGDGWIFGRAESGIRRDAEVKKVGVGRESGYGENSGGRWRGRGGEGGEV